MQKLIPNNVLKNQNWAYIPGFMVLSFIKFRKVWKYQNILKLNLLLPHIKLKKKKKTETETSLPASIFTLFLQKNIFYAVFY